MKFIKSQSGIVICTSGYVVCSFGLLSVIVPQCGVAFFDNLPSGWAKENTAISPKIPPCHYQSSLVCAGAKKWRLFSSKPPFEDNRVWKNVCPISGFFSRFRAVLFLRNLFMQV